MRRGLAVIVGLAVLMLVAPSLYPADKGKRKAPGKQGQRDQKKPPSRGVAFAEDLDAVDAKVSLTDEQKARLRKLKELRDEALAKIHGTSDSRARGAREQIEAECEKEMFAVLTAEQRAKWNAPILLKEMTKEFELLFLTSDQQERIGNLCQAQAGRIAVPLDPKRHAKAIQAVMAMVYRNILTSEQRREYARFAATKKNNADREDARRKGRGHAKGNNRRRNWNQGGNKGRKVRAKPSGGQNAARKGKASAKGKGDGKGAGKGGKGDGGGKGGKKK
jgi:hypothetical protein